MSRFIDPSELTYFPMSQNTMGGKEVVVSTNPDSMSLDYAYTFQTGPDKDHFRCRVPFGVSQPMQGAASNTNTRKMECVVCDEELISFLEKLDAHNVRIAHEKRVEYFKSPNMTDTQVEAGYKPCLKWSKNGDERMISLQIRLTGKDATQIGIVDEKRSKDDRLVYSAGTVEDIGRNDTVMGTVSISKLWFMGGKQFGMTLKVTSLLVWKKAVRGGLESMFLGKGVVKEEVAPAKAVEEEVGDAPEEEVA